MLISKEWMWKYVVDRMEPVNRHIELSDLALAVDHSAESSIDQCVL